MTDAVLRLEEVSFRRGEARPLRRIFWEVRAGEHWAVLGPNGSGKTTLAMIATGYLPSSSGRVYLLDGYISQIALPRVRTRVGIVSAALTDVMLMHRGSTTGLQAVLSGKHASLGLYERPTPEQIGQARGVMERFGIAHLAEARFSKMSTGQRQMCLVARCLNAQAELVILDEPCAGLDLAAREKLLAGLERSCRERPEVPLVLVTHHTQEIVPGVSHVLLMHGGLAVAKGPREQVLTEPNLEATFGLPLRIVRERERIWVIPRAETGP